jgi:thiol-disulfide isomerase/thioredoxin
MRCDEIGDMLRFTLITLWLTLAAPAMANELAIQFQAPATRPLSGQLQIDARVERYGPLPSTLPAPFNDDAKVSANEIRRLQKDDAYQHLRETEPVTRPTTLDVSENGSAKFEIPKPGIYAISATAIDAQPDHRGEPIIGRSVYVFAIAAKAPTTQPITVNIPTRPYLHIADPAPAISATTIDGKSFRLSAFHGQWTIVSFWATWCAPCVEELPKLQSIHKKFPHVAFVSMSFDDEAADVRKFLDQNHYDWPQVFLGPMQKSRAAEQWGVQVVPAMFLLDPNGNISGSYVSIDELAKLVGNVPG